jgi:hypothetical protein
MSRSGRGMWHVTTACCFPLIFLRDKSVGKSGANLWCCAVSWAFMSLWNGVESGECYSIYQTLKKKRNNMGRCMGGTGKRNEQTRRWVQKENGELTVISPTGENEDEKKQWNRKGWVLLIEIFMYFGNAYILSWDATTAFYTLLGILTSITLQWKTVRWIKISAHFFYENTF